MNLIYPICILIGVILILTSVLMFPTQTLANEAQNETIINENSTIVNDDFFYNMSVSLSDRLRSATYERDYYKDSYENLKVLYESKLYYEAIAEDIAFSYVYNSTFNCEDFSNMLTTRLKKAGYIAKTITGKVISDYCTYDNMVNYGCMHDWVMLSIPIEATTGRIISSEDYDKFYQEVS